MVSHNVFATPEAQEAHEQLRDIVCETRAEIGKIAAIGVNALDGLSPDPRYPRHTPMNLSGDTSLPPRGCTVRRVTPKLLAHTSLRGYPDLHVVGADTEHAIGQHFFGKLARPFGMKLPFLHSTGAVSLHIVTDETLETYMRGSRILSIVGDFRPGITVGGCALYGGDPTHDPAPRPPVHHPHRKNAFKFVDGEVVLQRYSSAFLESLAISGLIAHGLRAFGPAINLTNAVSLYGRWRSLSGNSVTPVSREEPLWLKVSEPRLQQHREALAT